MKLLRRALLCLGLVSSSSSAYAEGSLYDLKATTIDGEEMSLKEFHGQVTLVVNTASECGFTKQYQELEEIHKKYKEKGFSVLGFPSNDFMGQEPGSNGEIKEFCKLNYGVTFPLFAKNSVKGNDKQTVFRFLTEQSGDDFAGEVRWNFEKFLVNKDGKVIARFRTFTSPSSSKIVKEIEQLLQ